MVRYDEATGVDPEDMYLKVGNIKLPWPEDNDIKFWLEQLENKMRFAGIKSQFLKLQVLTNVLPAKYLPPIKFSSKFPLVKYIYYIYYLCTVL